VFHFISTPFLIHFYPKARQRRRLRSLVNFYIVAIISVDFYSFFMDFFGFSLIFLDFCGFFGGGYNR